MTYRKVVGANSEKDVKKMWNGCEKL